MPNKENVDRKDYIKILLAFRNPVLGLIIFLGLYFGLKSIPFFDYYFTGSFEQTLDKLLRSFLIFCIAWGFNNLESQSSFIFAGLSSKLQLNFDKIIIPFISIFLKFVTWAFAIFMIVQEWGYNVNGLIAGLGLGGLAFALAAKDTIANIFGGVVIIFDKPFTIGDFIADGNIEGTVESINFRSTKIRRTDQALVTIPNSILANSAIVNQSKMAKKQVNFKIYISCATAQENVSKAISEIKKVLLSSDQIYKENIIVSFSDISSTGLQLLINYFTVTTNYEEYMQIKEDINYQIIDILKNNEISLSVQDQARFTISN
jgi:MscS family membrane protein